MRSVNKKVMAIALAGRQKGPEGEERRVERYRELLSLTRKILHQAKGVLGEMQDLPSRRQARLKPHFTADLLNRIYDELCCQKAIPDVSYYS